MEADTISFDVWICTVELNESQDSKFFEVRHKKVEESHQGRRFAKLFLRGCYCRNAGSKELTELMINYMGIGGMDINSLFSSNEQQAFS